MKQIIQSIDFTRVDNDINGNPRYVCHFLNFITDKDREDTYSINTQGRIPAKVADIHARYEIAIKRAKKIGGKKFHNKQYGGGIVFQMYEGEIPEMSRKIREIANR